MILSAHKTDIARGRRFALFTCLLLLTCPVWAAISSMWPVLVAVSLAATVGLVLTWRQDPLTLREVVWGAILLRLVFFPLFPELTDDPFRYIWDGWLQVEGINPYRYVPAAEALEDFQTASLYQELNSQEYYSIYPPLSQFVFAVGGMFYESGWTVSYFVIKGIFLIAEGAGLYLLAQLTTARNVMLYAWNPLVLLETAGQGHTEALLMPFIFGAVWAVRQNRGALASIAVAGAGFVKLYPFALGPYLIRRFGWRAIWPGGLFAAALCAPYAAPYVLPHIKDSVDLFAKLFEFNAGPYYFVKHVAWLLTGADWSKVIGPTFRGLFLSGLPALYILDYRRNWSFRRASVLLFGCLFILSTTVHPWYVLPLIGLGVMGPRPSWHWIWLGVCSIGTYLFYIGGPYWTWIWLGWGGAGLLAFLRYYQMKAGDFFSPIEQKGTSGVLRGRQDPSSKW